MQGDRKFFLIIIVVTIAILIGGILFASKEQGTSSKAPQKVTDSQKKILALKDSDYIKGSSTASATLIEYGDFECPACGAYHPLVSQLLQKHPDNLRFIFRHFPLNQHQNAMPAAQAAEAAGIQGKFYDMYDLLFENQDKWTPLPKPKDVFIEYAGQIGLDKDKFSKDYELSQIKEKIQNSLNGGNQLSINQTPTFYLNDEKIQNPTSFEEFDSLIISAVDKAPKPTQSSQEDYHIHANFKVVLDNGQAIDFTQAKYQSTEGKELNPYIHLHDGVGDVIHIHKKGITLGEFFSSLKIKLAPDCFTLDTGEKYCNSETQKLRMFINGKENNQFDSYVPNDLDRILIVYGSPTEDVASLVTNVADSACIYSLKCPERGTPPTENCVGGLGTGCKD